MRHSFPTRSSSDLMGDAGFCGSGRPLGQIFNPPTDSGNRHDQQTSVIGLTNSPLQVGPAASARGASMMANRTTRNVPKIGRSPRIILSPRSEEHTSELQSLMRISYAVFCLKQKKNDHISTTDKKQQ